MEEVHAPTRTCTEMRAVILQFCTTRSPFRGSKIGEAVVTLCTCDPNAPMTAICWLCIDYIKL